MTDAGGSTTAPPSGPRSGAAAGHRGYFHETAFYDSDDALLELVVPFVLDGVRAGEPTLVTFDQHNARSLRTALGDTRGIRFVPGTDQYRRPAATIRSYRQLFAEHTRAGAAQIRVVGDVPHPGTGYDWDEWARYEAAVNHAYDDFPVWGLCPYDTRITPAAVLDEVTRTHPRISAGGRHEPNPAFQDPQRFLASRPPSPVPTGPGAAALVLDDPTPTAARHEVDALCGLAGLGTAEHDDLLLAVSETVANAVEHGRAPVELRAWVAEGYVVVTVTDQGPGPEDPYAGLLAPSEVAEAGRGLWIVHQLRTRVSLHPEPHRFTVALVAGHLPLAA